MIDKKQMICSNLVTKLSGHFPPDFNRQTYADFGEYDKCLSINLHEKYNRNSSLAPHYCLISLEPDFRKFQSLGIGQDAVEKLIPFDFESEYGQSLKIGLCVPPSCTSEDIDATLDHGMLILYQTQSIFHLESLEISISI